MDQNTCNICNQRFNSNQELQEHQKNAHGTRKEGDRPGEENRREDKIAS